MQSFELEEMALFLIRDADEAEMWIDRWAVSYPIVQTAEADSRQTISEWQHAIQTAFDHIVSRNIAVVAHGVGVSAFLAWLYQADILTQKRLTNIILVSPSPEAFPEDEIHTFQRVRCPCRTALVIAETNGTPRDWAQEQADRWQARLLQSPHSGQLNSALGGWQWGMKLMQEMLLSK